MKNYIYQNALISKKQLKQLLAWSFSKYNSIQAGILADELKYLGFRYATKAGISISIEDLKVPPIKQVMLKKAYKQVLNTEKLYVKGKITEVERFQKVIDTWAITSESLKNEVISYFNSYDPLNSVYIMAFSGARGNISQVRQLVGMRGLMSDPSGEILKLPIKKNFREGLTITDYLMSGYGARKGIVDTALKTANSGYLTRRLIDVSQDIIIREKDCKTSHSCLLINLEKNKKSIFKNLLGRVLSKSVYHPKTNELIGKSNQQITPKLIKVFKNLNIAKFYIRSPLTCSLYRSICQKCYGWDLANENLVDIGEAIGIIAGQSIGEPGTQLTMRTFHTGGIFTSELRQQIISSSDGIAKFSKNLKFLILRTNRGDNVLLIKNSGSLIIVPKIKNKQVERIDLLPNTIVFVKNNQYIKIGTVIGEVDNIEKQVRTEIKPIVTSMSGEIIVPTIKNKDNFINKNRLLWLLSGNVYYAPTKSFINFYNDHKINKNSYIFRTKLINQCPGVVNFLNSEKDIFNSIIEIETNNYKFSNSNIQELTMNQIYKRFILTCETFQYLINLKKVDSNLYLDNQFTNNFAILLTNKFKTKTGGILFYNFKVYQKSFLRNNIISYFKNYQNILLNLQNLDDQLPKDENNHENYSLLFSNLYDANLQFIEKSKRIPLKINLSTIIWVAEETYKLKCNKNLLLVENETFISENFELVPGLFSKTSGVVTILERNNIVYEIIIKCGLVYEGKDFKQFLNKVYYPGEMLFKNIKITKPSLCQTIGEKSNSQLLIRPICLYETPKLKVIQSLFNKNSEISSILDLKITNNYFYKSTQKIKSANNINLFGTALDLNIIHSLQNKTKIKFIKNKKIEFLVTENIYLPHYLQAYLKYVNIDICKLIEKNQFIDSYTTFAYFETIISKSLEIVKIKVKTNKNKEILLISNDDCLVMKKQKNQKKAVNDLFITPDYTHQIGRIINDNGKVLTIQKGRPYFFPNCEVNNSNSNLNSNLCYKVLLSKYLPFSNKFEINHSVFLNYHDITKKTLKTYVNLSSKKLLNGNFFKRTFKIESSKMFIKKYGKLYSSTIPFFVQNFLLSNQKYTNKSFLNQLTNKYNKNELHTKTGIHYSMFLKNSEIISNKDQKNNTLKDNLLRVKFCGYPFSKFFGIHAITEDYFQQEMNSVFCEHGQFVPQGQIIGLLNLEKEITGDIVQGLPRIEELLEARKKKQISKNVSTNQKKCLVVQKTSLDHNLDFKKLGSTIKETEKVNPHNLLKVYFNYYGSTKNFFCDRKQILKSHRLLDNYEASYKSFKKVQSLILNSVQSVYNSQGVNIADKHLEVIIKQMTTKVLITHEGDTPLLPREVIDLYHINYINNIIKQNNKQIAFYVPLLLGITKAALNNPSFISAASFQETTNVLTKAAIEGRVDWLRGLKENIIIGHLIPAGTGYKNYKYSFDKKSAFVSNIKNKTSILENTQIKK